MKLCGPDDAIDPLYDPTRGISGGLHIHTHIPTVPTAIAKDTPLKPPEPLEPLGLWGTIKSVVNGAINGLGNAIEDYEIYQRNMYCTRCGRKSHYADNCYARRHANGRELA